MPSRLGSRRMSDPLTIGYLQVGRPEHGICRYGRLLAAEGRRRPELQVREENIVLTGDSRGDRHALRVAARELSSVDLVHLQVSIWTDGSWGPREKALRNLGIIRRHCRAPLVATLHDVNGLRIVGCSTRVERLLRISYELGKFVLRPPIRLLQQLAAGQLAPADLFRDLWTLEPQHPYRVARKTARIVRRLFTLTDSERNVLDALALSDEITLIPHFVEEAPEVPGAAPVVAASRAQTVVVAGFLFRSKGHQIVLEAMLRVPDVRVVFVGGPSLESGAKQYHSEIMTLALRMGVQERLEVTGYVSDEEYYRRIAAADLAVCPFAPHKSASGSLSSLIAAGCPVLASDIPLIAGYNAMVPGAIPTFRPYTAEALAEAIRATLAKSRADLAKPLAELRERLSIARVYDQHLDEYRRALGRSLDRGMVRA